MKKYIFFIITLIGFIGLAQKSNLSATLSYPLPIADKTFSAYTGIIDIGLNYKFYESDYWQLGTSLNAGYFAQKTNFINPTFRRDENVLLLQPKVFTSLKVGQNEEIRPFLAMGYSFAIYGIDFNVPNGPPEESIAKGGFNIAAGTIFEISNRMFAIVQYDYIAFSSKDGGLNIVFSNNFSIIKLGLGYKF